MIWKIPACGILLAMVCVQTQAQGVVPSDAELSNLPAFCTARLKSGIGSPDYRMWENQLGKDFMHTHHYCLGINFINRYYRSRTQQDKRLNLNNAMGNLSYMVTHADPAYSLMPDVYQNRGLVYSLMGRHGEAVSDMNKAIELNPHQVKAYNVLADYYSSTRQPKQALETIIAGLRHNPDTRSLQRRYTQLGGKLPYPEPIQPSTADASSSSPKTEAAPSAAPADAAPTETPAGSGQAEPVAPPQPATESKIGSPTNPYCRFCPD